MSAHEGVSELLALSAAGLLGPAGERFLREHLAGCPECALAAAQYAELSACLGDLPAPGPPPGLAARTEALIASELAARADSRGGMWITCVACLMGWLLPVALWSLYRWEGPAWLPLGPQTIAWIGVAVLGSTSVAAGAVAVLIRRSRLSERSLG